MAEAFIESSGGQAHTGRIERKKDFIDVQVPLNEIKVAIARWKEEKQTS